MNLSALFIKRPVTTTLIVLGIIVFGAMSYRLLPVSDLPTVDFPTIQVNAGLPGASPETMASAVALPLEKQFATIAGLNSINSTSAQGNTNITLQFDLSRNIDAAAQDVQAMIAKTARQLPPQMPAPPSYQKVNPGDQPVLFLVLHSQTLPLSLIDEYAESTIAQRISMVNGVAQVNVFGAAKYAVRIDVDPRKLAAHGLGIDEVANSITNANVNLPTGTIYGEDKTFVVQANGQLLRAMAYGPTIITYRNGNPVRLNEVAHVYDGIENDKSAAWYNGERTIYLAVQKQPGTNVVAVCDAVKALLPTFREQLPASLSLDVRTDRSIPIRESVADVKFTLLLTIGLVVAVIFLFLRNLSATIIPSLALPASIVGTFAVMYLLDYSLDNLSLMALTLSVGFVVDDAIVMLENIVRHMEMGKPPMRAAFDGSKEISFTIISMTISLVAVFIPVLFMGGVVGRLLHEFAVTIGVAILVSGIVSISLTPMLCSRFLKPPHTQKHGWFYNATERMFQAWLRLYDWSLRLSLRFGVVTMAVSVALVVGTGYLFTMVPKGFLPSEDQGRFNISTEGIQGIGFDEMVRHQMQVAEIVAKDPDILSTSNNVGCRSRRRRTEQRARERRPAAQERAEAIGRPDHGRAEAQARADPGRAGVHGQPAADQPRRPAGRAQPVSVHAAGHRHRGALQVRADPRSEGARDSRDRRRLERPADQEPPGAGHDGSRQDFGPRAQRQSGRDRAVQRVRHAPGLADLRAQQPVPGHPAGRAAVPEGSGGDVDALRPLVRRIADPAEHRRDDDDGRRPADRQPHRPAAVGDHLVQPEARRRAGRRGHRDPSGGRRPPCRRRFRPCSRARRRRSRTRCAV